MLTRLPSRAALIGHDRAVVHRLALDHCLAKMLYDRLCATGVLHEALRAAWGAALDVFWKANRADEHDCFKYKLFYASGKLIRCGRLYGEVSKPLKDGSYEWYGAMVSFPRIFKDSLFSFGGWIDFDQVKGHPTIMRWVAQRMGVACPYIDLYLDNFSFVASKIIEYMGGGDWEESDIKDLYNITLYGGSWRTWIKMKTEPDPKKPWKTPKATREISARFPELEYYWPFVEEVRTITDRLYEANPEFAAAVTNGTKWTLDEMSAAVTRCQERFETVRQGESREAFRERKKKGRFMSFYLQQIEGTFTDLAWQYAVNQGICRVKEFDLAHDGFTCKPLMEPPEDFVDRMNEYVRAASGCPYVTFTRKAFKVDPRAVPIIEERRAMTDQQVWEYLRPRVVGAPLQEVMEVEQAPHDPFDLLGYFADLKTLEKGQDVDTKEEAYEAVKAFFEQTVYKIYSTARFRRIEKAANVKIEGKKTLPRDMVLGTDYAFSELAERDLLTAFRQYKYKYKTWQRTKNGEEEVSRGLVEEASFVERWYKDHALKTVKDVSDHPWSISGKHDLDDDGKVALFYENLHRSRWIPFRYELAALSFHPQEYHVADLQRFLNHIMLLCGGEEPLAAFVVYWLAHMLQYPEVAGVFAVVMYGTQGAGKSLFTNILGNMFGEEKFMEPSTDEHVMGKYNAAILNKILISLNEFETPSKTGTNGQHKSGTTEAKKVVRELYKEARTVKTAERYIYISNSATPPMHVDSRERRYVYLNASDVMIGNSDYLGEADELAVKESFLISLHWYLSHIDLSRYMRMSHPPQSKYHKALLYHYLPEHEEFLGWFAAFLQRTNHAVEYTNDPLCATGLRAMDTKGEFTVMGSEGEGKYWVSRTGLATAWIEYVRELHPTKMDQIGTKKFLSSKLLHFQDCVINNPRDRSGVMKYTIDAAKLEQKLTLSCDKETPQYDTSCCAFPLPFVKGVAEETTNLFALVPVLPGEDTSRSVNENTVTRKRKFSEYESSDSPNAL